MITPGISLNGKQRAGLSSRRPLIGILGSRASPDPALYFAVPRLRRYFARLAKDASERGTATRSQRGRVPPMRMTASWSGSKRTYRIQVCGAKTRPNSELPSDHYADQRRETPELRRKAHLAVHRPSACSGVKALRNTSDASRQAAKLCCRFGPLTPSARSANLIPGDATKNGL